MRSILAGMVIIIGLASCSVNPMACPTPEAVRLKKLKAHRFKYAMAKYKEDQAGNKIEYFPETASRKKDLKNIEEWDCPKPGLKHDKMVQKKARDLQRRYAQNIKKVAKESEDRTVTYGSPQGETNK